MKNTPHSIFGGGGGAPFRKTQSFRVLVLSIYQNAHRVRSLGGKETHGLMLDGA